MKYRGAVTTFLMAASPLVLAVGPGRAQKVDPICERYFPAADVAKAAHRKSVRILPQNANAQAQYMCNYAEGDEVLMNLRVWKVEADVLKDEIERTHMEWDGFKERKPVSGLGDEAVFLLDSNFDARKGRLFVEIALQWIRDPRKGGFVPAISREELIGLVRSAFAKDNP